ncbi:MAG: hypothetical protein HY809_04200 [Nitrospirae bacterium]|nr:hypothetical protein [Nitrospirota bacterium]
MYYSELKKAVIGHLIAGVIFAAVLFLMIFSVRYGKSLSEAVVLFEKEKQKHQQMNQAVTDLENVMLAIDEMLPEGYYSRGHRDIILLAIADIKSNLRFADVKVEDFQEANSEIVLPVIIEFPVEDYTVMTESVAYIQSFRFPYFIFDDINIVRDQKTPDIICKIQGSIRMPAGRLSQPLSK